MREVSATILGNIDFSAMQYQLNKQKQFPFECTEMRKIAKEALIFISDD